MKLNVRAFSMTCALLWGGGLFLATLWILLLDGGSPGPTFIGRVYRGYSITPVGSLAGLAWGLLDGMIGGALFAWIYNRMAGRSAKGSNA